ncbi:hypothetical protein Clacol_005506 [Clathrus columnatus]|uniref:Translation machinery-associated protein 16 n=1 Tax=Clathrus columnatus TaxID=1419009 RepID=A0AAV5AEZ9_9AGAM|nr:hypothetical protein Clacol_005506 [Clathrus columnatus]
MVSPTKSAPKSNHKHTKEKIFHPQSRKAGQLERVQLRKAKLVSAAQKKVKRESAKVDRFVFFYHAIAPEVDALSLEELHTIVRDIWLKRHDEELEQEKTLRRKGRPKSVNQLRLEEIILQEREEYRTGFEVPDLTHAATVKLFRQWGQTGVGYLDILRYIRINSEDLTQVVVSKPGRHESLKNQDAHMSKNVV